MEFLERQSPHKIQLILDALDEIRKEEAKHQAKLTGKTTQIGSFG